MNYHKAEEQVIERVHGGISFPPKLVKSHTQTYSYITNNKTSGRIEYRPHSRDYLWELAWEKRGMSVSLNFIEFHFFLITIYYLLILKKSISGLFRKRCLKGSSVLFPQPTEICP